MSEPKTQCERCARTFERDETRFICSYACTYCEACTRELNGVCRNCGGMLSRIDATTP